VRLSEAYLAWLDGPTPECRFDVVAVELDSFPPQLRHLKDAFSADSS